MKSFRVSVVGGSIAGCAVAVMLRRLGATVQVFERSEAALQERGAGIVLPAELMAPLIEQDILDADVQRLTCKERNLIIKDAAEPHWGKTLWTTPFSPVAMNWGTLFANLRKRLPDDCYHAGAKVIAASQDEAQAQLQFEDGTMVESDIILFADGYNSVGRQLLFSEAKPTYCDYVVWRGLVDGDDLPDINGFVAVGNYYLCAQGHALYYLIPKPDDMPGESRYLLNWVLYENLMHSKTQYPESIPPGQLSAEQIAHLHELAATQFPGIVAEVTRLTARPFLQSIYELNLPHIVQGRIGLSGDAEFVLRPHVAAGATKALQNALLLGKVFSQPGITPVEALAAWGAQVQATNSKFSALSASIGRAMVTESPDWQRMTTADMPAWWESVMAGQAWYATKD